MSLETTAPDLGRLFIGEMGEALFRPPACQHDAIIYLGGVSRRGKMRLLGIATKRGVARRRGLDPERVFGSDKNLPVAILVLQTQLRAATAASFKRKTTSKSCWNYTAKGCKRKSPLTFPPSPPELSKRSALGAMYADRIGLTGVSTPAPLLFPLRTFTHSDK